MIKVLVVDDNEDNVYYLTSLLGCNDCEVETARDGAEALTKARKAPPDVIVADLLMPVMDGYTLLRHWKADPRLQRVPFVVYTATYTQPEDEALALSLGADAFILKPSEPEAFLDRLRRVMAQQGGVAAASPSRPTEDEEVLLARYSQSLVRKLERRSAQLEESNREAAERAAVLRAVFDSVPDTVIYLDLEGHIKLVNRPPPGVAAEALLGTSWLSSSPPGQGEIMRRAWESTLATGQPTSFESRGMSLSGTAGAWWTTIAPVLREGEIVGAVVVSRDITERKQTEAQLMVSERMASVGTLAAGVAHEINNPLASVVINLNLALEELEGPSTEGPTHATLIDELRDAREGAERVRTIVRDLRIFSRGEDAKLGPVDVEKVLDSTVRMAWNELRHRARVVRVNGRVPAVQGDESRLGQVLLNLVVNAAQAIREGDHDRNEIRIETKLDDAHPRRVLIIVTDTGCGIPPEIQARLFTPFLSSKPVGVGTGLGLSICHRIVTSLGGTIDFSSTPGHGSTFRVSLPVADAPLATTDAARDPARGARAGRRGDVLVVDDDEMVIHAIERVLGGAHQVQVVGGAEQALELFEAGQRFDVVLCDLMMPQITGQELHRRLLELDAGQAARVVFMTGGDFTPAARSFLDRAPNPRIEKPFDIDALRALVNRLVTAAGPATSPAVRDGLGLSAGQR